jgi:hypothetical protein
VELAHGLELHLKTTPFSLQAAVVEQGTVVLVIMVKAAVVEELLVGRGITHQEELKLAAVQRGQTEVRVDTKCMGDGGQTAPTAAVEEEDGLEEQEVLTHQATIMVVVVALVIHLMLTLLLVLETSGLKKSMEIL